MTNLGKVQSIRECYWQNGRWATFEGYEIATDKHAYKVVINNIQSCCETWGYCVCNEEATERYIGKVLVDVRLTDTALSTKKLKECDVDPLYANIQFVDFCFADGDVLQLAVYNEHNGYYGHDILVIRDREVIEEGCL